MCPCDECKGKRYDQETLSVRYKGKNIADVLEMTVEEGLAFFANIPSVQNKLQTLYDVGLGYVRLGQPAPTLEDELHGQLRADQGLVVQGQPGTQWPHGTVVVAG